jgi:microcystin-dependent protein
MSDPYIGEIRMFAGNFSPQGWMFCQGQVLPIATYDVLFTLIGTTYGGDGQSTFALPDLQGRLPLHFGQRSGSSNFTLGQKGGVETVTLTSSQMPVHTHAASVSSGVGHLSEPQAAVAAAHRDFPAFSSSATGALAPGAVAVAGASQPHNNVAPFLCLSFIICFAGVFPPS